MTQRPASAPRAARRAAAPLFAAGLLAALAACHPTDADKAALAAGTKVDVISDTELGEVMLNLADSDAAVEYYRRALGRDPEKRELQRGYALALARDGQNAEAALAFENLLKGGAIDEADRVTYARVLAHLDRWDEAGATLDALPQGYATAPQMQLRGMIADHRGDWPSADAAYQAALGLTAQPASIHNNIGVSMMSRGDMKAAEAAFQEALRYDSSLFSAKNNLALSYALQKQYRLPLVPMSEEERAVLLHNIAVVALRQGDKKTAITLLERAVATHPRHWPPAADKLAALRAEGGA